jgi:hypothetical protein
VPTVSVERPSASVTIVRTVCRPGTTLRVLLRSDAHHDSIHADRDLERRHLTEALGTDAYVCDFGDLFDAMQGRFDPRRGPDRRDLRQEYWDGHYLDRLVDVAAERYEPFAARWLLMAPGNHETAVAKRHEVDLTDRLVQAIRFRRPDVPLRRGTYAGWILFRFQKEGDPKHGATLRLYYHHGYGGGGPVTRGTIQTARMAVYLPDADIVVSGHTHDHWTLPIARARVTDRGHVREDRQLHVRLAGYKGEFLDGEGWAIERGMPPKPKGAAWLSLAFGKSHEQKRLVVTPTVAEAT